MTAKRETAIVRAILKALQASRVWCWRENAGLTVIKKGGKRRVIRGAPPGTPDILGYLKSGRGFGLEVKTLEGTQRVSQKLWESLAKRGNVRYAIVRSVRGALDCINLWEYADRIVNDRRD